MLCLCHWQPGPRTLHRPKLARSHSGKGCQEPRPSVAPGPSCNKWEARVGVSRAGGPRQPSAHRAGCEGQTPRRGEENTATRGWVLRWRIPRHLPSKRMDVLSLTLASRDPPSRRGLPGPPPISSPASRESGSTAWCRRGWGPRQGADDPDSSETDERSPPTGPGSKQRVGSPPLSGFRFLDGFLAALREQMLPPCTAGEALSLVAEGARKTELYQGQGRRRENMGPQKPRLSQMRRDPRSGQPASCCPRGPRRPETPAQGREGLQACDPLRDSGSGRVGPALQSWTPGGE